MYRVIGTDIAFISKRDFKKYQEYCNQHRDRFNFVADTDIEETTLYTFDTWLAKFENENEKSD